MADIDFLYPCPSSQYICYTLFTEHYGAMFYKIPKEIQFDYELICEYINHDLDLSRITNKRKRDEIIEALHKSFVRKNINNFDIVEEIEYEKYKKQIGPFEIVYSTGKIGGNGYFKNCELVLTTLNKDYFEI